MILFVIGECMAIFVLVMCVLGIDTVIAGRPEKLSRWPKTFMILGFSAAILLALHTMYLGVEYYHTVVIPGNPAK